MTDRSQPWARRFEPRTRKDLVGNGRAVDQLVRWLRSWEKGIPKRRAAFLHGPPGVGKTASVVAVANDLGFDLIEVNASDDRTRKRIDDIIGRASMQRLTVLGKRRLILVDELEGVSGREDYGGLGAIAGVIKETRSPVVLVATSATESWEERFRPLRRISQLIEFGPIRFADILRKLTEITRQVGVSVDDKVLELIAERSKGDLRSAINDLEGIARGRERVSLEDVKWFGERDRQTYTSDALMRLFSARTLRDARQIVSSAYINYDELYEWIYENLPLVFDDPRDLADGLDALARADIHQRRAKGTQAYRLLKYMFNAMTGGVALARRRSQGAGPINQTRSRLMRLGFPPSAFTLSEEPEGVIVKPVRYLGNDWGRVNSALRELGGRWISGGGAWTIPYFRPPQLVWRSRRTWHSRRLRRSVAARVAEMCHVSTREAVDEVIPLLRVIFHGDEGMAGEVSAWLGLEEKEAEWLSS
ncbi:MAG: replication factor C large subunit [Candidatus Bathyarchaeia archaeon]